MYLYRVRYLHTGRMRLLYAFGKAIVKCLNNFIITILILVFVSGFSFKGFGATKTWNGGTGTGKDWTTNSNWNPSGVPSSGDDIVFNTPGTITFSTLPTANISYNSLTINQGTITLAGTTRTFTLGGNTGIDFTIASGATLIATNVNITLANSATATIAGTYNNPNTFNTDGTSVATTVTGMVVNSGTITNSTASKLNFNSGSTYQHAQNGGTIPTATWNVNSTCYITGCTGTAPGGYNQTFGNFTWECAGQTTYLALGTTSSNATTSVQGNLTVAATGDRETGVNNDFNIEGNITVGGNFIINRSAGSSAMYRLCYGEDRTLTVNGDVILTSGELAMNTHASSGSYTGTLYVKGNFTHTGGTISNDAGSGKANIVFNGTSKQTYTSGGTFATGSTAYSYINFTVNNGAYLQMGTGASPAIIPSSDYGTFTLSPGATLGITSPLGITTTGATGNIQVTTRNYISGANYIYNGSAAQAAGDGLTQNNNTPHNLTINNSQGVTLSANTSLDGTGILNLTNGILSTGAFTMTVTNNSTSAVTGGSTTNFVNGPLIWTLAAGSTYNYPVGKGTTYLPFGIAGISGTAPQIRVEAFTANAGGTASNPLISLSTTEYWLASVASGPYTNGSVSLARQTALGTLNAIGRSSTLSGAYSNLNGTISGTSINNSDNTGNSLGYFLMALLNTITTGTITGSPFCAGASVNVPFTISGVFNAGNVFTAQLSDASGSFASPVTLGTLTQTTAGTISGTIPAGTTGGSGYRIRVVSSSPAITGSNNGVNITINPLPAAAGTISGTATVCQGQNGVAYSVPAITNATGYTWSLPTGASIASGNNTNSITVNYSTSATSGNITVRGTNACGNGAISPNYAVTVNPLPVAAGTISGTATVCQGQNGVTYSVPAITNATGYTWSLPTGATIASGSNTNSITVNFSASATSGNVTVTGTNACGSGTISSNYGVTVNPLPAAAGTITGTTPVCQAAG
jgi:hypothetical protein